MILGERQKKAGVSLVTVLLFMLVATIAATATYKWLTSEGRSSGARLQRQMAYQSAVAGIENARAWMTFHANDVGALVKQYMDGNYVPINLDANLRPLQRPGQNHHVWLVGVNTSGSTYKLKVLSSGEASGGTRHSEIAILNVTGLYQVALPVPQGVKKKIPFDYAYFGGSYNGAGSLTMTSAIVNGNWYGNPQGIEKKFVVTGDANLTGNNVSIGELACVGGNMAPENNGLQGNDVYVGKNFTGNISITGNAYFGGDVSPSSAGAFNIGGHVTLNGNLQTVQSARPLTIDGDLCMAENAHILSKGTNYTFETGGNVWMPGKQNIWYGSVKYSDCTCERVFCNWMGQCQPKTTVACLGGGKFMEGPGWATYSLLSCAKTDLVSGGDNYQKYDKIVLGGAGKTVYIKSGHPWSDYSDLVTAKTFTETKDAIIKCNFKPGVAAPDAQHGYCDTNHEGTVGPGERWDGGTYSPYEAHANGGSNAGMSYIYYMDPGHVDVELKDYNDTYWIKCTKWVNNLAGGQYCEEEDPPGVLMLNYFVDGERFWDGYEGHDRKRLNYENGKATGSPYCYNQTGIGKAKFRPKCGVTPWFKTNGNLTNTEPTTKFECANAVKDSCNGIWEKKPGCDGSSYKVDDVLVTAKTMFEPYASKGCAASITRYDKDLVTKLQACYDENNNDETKKKSNLYNGYLVVKVSGGTNSTNPTGTLNGKFIIIARDALYTKLPPTTENSSVLLYLEKGANTLNDVTVSNYFIYTEGDIGSGNQFNLTGTIYASAESCAGLGKLQSSSITYNQRLVDDLSDAGVICPNDGSVCGGVNVSGGSGGSSSSAVSGESSESSTTTSGTDAYYISMAPQLGVTLESQYENNETIPSGENQTNLSPSFIVLPRIIYLPNDPFGELQEYYNVLPLNGSTLKKTDVSVASCVGTTGSIPTTGKLFTGTVLSKGIYTCTARANGYDDVPFWVVVGDSHRGNLPITFVETDQKIAAGGSKQVHVMIPPNTPSVQLSVRCPTVNEDDDLTYVVEGGSQEGNTCTFSVQGDASGSKSVHLFTVNAKAGATTGSIMFQLLSGEGYSIGSPYTSEVYMASLATLERVEVTEDDITAYCNEHPGCPPVGSRSESAWPNCTTDETWVEPTGITYGTDQKNNRWTLVVGGSGTLQFTGRDIENCMTIIPTENNSIDISTIVAGAAESKHLRASLKALEKTVALTFVGDVSDNPSISIYINGTKTGDCVYESSGDDKTCYVHAFSGQSVSFSIDKSLYRLFNYWSCSGASCPTTSAISSTTYDSFTLRDDNSVVYAHFNESDKHCFFDEFKNGTVSCVSKDTVYCVHNCGSSNDDICVSATDVTEYKAKWHLMSGKKSDIYEEAGNISLRRQGRTNVDPVTVLSTVNAGVYGTLKALFQLPKETANHNRNTAEISKSGFLLHSNTTGSEYLMLNMFAGRDGYLTAQLCSNNGRCLDGKLANGYGNFASVYASNMIMMAATIGVDGNLTVAAFTGNYYGTPDEYDIVFNLDELGSSYMDVAHEFVGFSLADPNFKLYGIGWKSDSYSAQCHDTYPIVKCSFAAVSTNGVIPTEKNVKPWVGHSGWFDSESCTDNYFYYNGGDLSGCSATNNDAGANCGSDSLYFEETGKGTHGYTNTETGKEMKTVKATLSCTPSSTETASWASTVERAHCGPFWTGKIQECTDHAALATNQNIGANLETTVTLTNTANLRATTLAIELNETTSNIDLDIWLVSDNSGYYDEGDTSKSVHMTSQKAEFNVDDAMSAGAGGFDPEHVKQIVIKNRGTSALYAKSIVASCKNATDITACSANYADGKWTVLVDVVNKDEIASFGAEAKVDGATVFEISSTNPTVTDGKIALEHADNPYAEHQGKSYGFTASIVNKTGTTASKACTVNPQTIGSITRSCDVTGSPKKQGEGLPQFNINISGCPSTGCSYEVYIGDAMLDGYPKNTTSASINLTPDGNGNTPQGSSTQTSDYAVGTYTYKVKSPDTATYPFSECSKTFEITEKGNTNTEAKTECWFASSNIQPGANANFKAYVNSHGYNICNRAYELRNSSGTKVAEGTSTGCGSELSFDINGTKTLVSDNFKLYVREGNSFVSACYADASLTVQELSPRCTIQNENGKDYFYVSFTGSICASSNYCSYNVKRTYNGTTTSITGGNVGLSQNSFKAGEMTGFGNYVLWLNDKETTCAINVEEPDPAFTCPADLKAIVGRTDNVSITLGSVSGCANGCSYTIAGTSVTTQEFVYHFGALPSFTNNTNAVGTTAKYEVSLTNNKTTVKHECEVEFIAEPVVPIDNPGQVACYTDGNYNWGSNSVKIKIDNRDGTYSSKSYIVKDASGNNSLATGTTGTNQQIEIQMGSSYYATDSKLRVFIAGTEVCSLTPRVKKPYLKDCKANGSDKVHFQIEQCDNSRCRYQVKKDGTPVSEETNGSGGIDVSVSGNGIYVVWLNGVETSCRIPIGTTMTTPAHCYFPQARKWGETEGQLKMDNPGQFMNNKAYVIKDAADNEYGSGTGGGNSVVDMSLTGYYATDVTLYVYVGTELYCSADPITYGPYAYDCYIQSGTPKYFKFGIGDCTNSMCSYVVKRDGTPVSTVNNVGESGGYQLEVSTAGTYVLWLNGRETGCRATLP